MDYSLAVFQTFIRAFILDMVLRPPPSDAAAAAVEENEETIFDRNPS